MNSKKFCIASLFTFLLFQDLTSQSQFSDKTSHYQINHNYGIGTAGGGVSFVDFSGDGLDDLTLASGLGGKIFFFINKGDGTLQKVDLLPNHTIETKHVLWVDYDNDGDKDLFLSLADHYNLLYNNTGNLNLMDVTAEVGLPTDNVFTSFGACWGDYNRDGWLDLYYGQRRAVTSENNRSQLWLNQGGDKFINVTESSLTIDDNGKTPFCSSFVDVNNDRWPDIYTAHDRMRGNTLLLNQHDGTFSDQSEAMHCNLKMDGMSVSIADYNHDGWQDIYVSNTSSGNALFVNDHGVDFENLAEDKGVAYKSVAWGTNFLDGDNDGDQDLYVSGMIVGSKEISSRYYENQYPLDTFILPTQIGVDTVASFNNAVGDINNDGYPDIAVINLGFPSFVFQNVGGSNHFIKIKLHGQISNKDATGSLITVYSGGESDQKYTNCGIGFMGQNSEVEIFGLGTNQFADSITILWPTGHIDRFYNIPANQVKEVTEGESTNGVIHIDSDVQILNSLFNPQQVAHLTVYPNPSDGTLFHVSGLDNICVGAANLYSALGQHQTLIMDNNSGQVNANLKPGIYYLEILDCNHIKYVSKFFVR